ncbi:MAG: DUF4860 domain-containing protein [Lachnospiraceae bacterium]|nr:DUF4860 domain-containing protein [Lachnospiraceae bacterium]
MNGAGERAERHNVDVLAALLLLCAFAVCILSVLTAGTKSYRSLTVRDSAVFERTTRSLYVSTKISQAVHRGAVSVENITSTDRTYHTAGGDAAREADRELSDTCIRIDEEIGGVLYATRIYYYDGWIRELFARADYRYSPQDGEKISEAVSLDASADDGVLKVVIDEALENEEVLYFSLEDGT